MIFFLFANNYFGCKLVFLWVSRICYVLQSAIFEDLF